MSRRVVITGTGLITALGTGTEKNWGALLAGKSGVAKITRFDGGKLTVNFAGEVKDFEAAKFIDHKEARRMDLFCQYALAAAEMAISESGIPIGKGENAYDPEMVGVIVGSGIGGLASFEESHTKALQKGFDRLSPFFILQMIVNMAPGRISMKHNAKGPNWSTVSACSTSAHAIGDAARLVAYGDAEVMVAGGAESPICRIAMAGFAACRALATAFNDRPGIASRPYDRDRDGFVMGEGAGIVVLESLEHAKARGAKIYAEVVGYGLSGDAYHITAPSEDGDGAFRCMRMALKRAGLQASDIDYVNAHGTSTMADEIELKAVERLFGNTAARLSMSSPKSAIGHLLGAAGAVEAIFGMLAIRDNIAPPTLNLDNPSVETAIDLVPHKPRRREINTVLSNSFGFGGTNASLILRRVA